MVQNTYMKEVNLECLGHVMINDKSSTSSLTLTTLGLGPNKECFQTLKLHQYKCLKQLLTIYFKTIRVRHVFEYNTMMFDLSLMISLCLFLPLLYVLIC